MNPKLIIASIAGIGALGGTITSGYYYFNPKEETNTSNSKSQTNDATVNSNQQQNVNSSPTTVVGNADQRGSSPSEPSVRSDSTSGGSETTSNRASSERGVATLSTGTGGVAATGIDNSREVSASG